MSLYKPKRNGEETLWIQEYRVQIWLDNAFYNYFYYDVNGTNSGSYPLELDGMTGNRTIKALIAALQIHLNLSPS